jgi:membrane fusion protein, multidrug efflux system
LLACKPLNQAARAGAAVWALVVAPVAIAEPQGGLLKPVALQPGGSQAAQGDSPRVLLVPALDTTLSSPVAGRIKVLESSLGASFGAGKILLAFDCDEQLARQKMGQAELAAAQETHEAKLRLQGLEQASDVEVALAAAAAAKARAQLALATTQVAQCQVLAPWAGRVAKVHVRNHMSVTPGQPLLDLVKAGPLKLKLSVPSRWLARLKQGLAFEVAIDETGKAYPAQITALNSRIDPVSQSIEIEAILIRPHAELLAGMSGTARFSGELK